MHCMYTSQSTMTLDHERQINGASPSLAQKIAEQHAAIIFYTQRADTSTIYGIDEKLTLLNC